MILLNIVMLGIAVFWFVKGKELEPIIVAIGQLATILSLFFENEASKIFTKKVKNNSTVDVDVHSGDNVETEDIDNSKVNIKTNK